MSTEFGNSENDRGDSPVLLVPMSAVQQNQPAANQPERSLLEDTALVDASNAALREAREIRRQDEIAASESHKLRRSVVNLHDAHTP